MSIVKSAWGEGRKQAPVSSEAGTVKCERFTYTIPAGTSLAIGDIIELAVLPAYHVPVDATVVADAIGTSTLDVGIMSGIVGSADQARTCGNELFAAAAGGVSTRMSKPAGFRIAPIEGDRAIGVKVLVATITGAAQVIDLLLYTKQ